MIILRVLPSYLPNASFVCLIHSEAKQTETSVWSRERFIAGPSKENEWLLLRTPKVPDGFQGEVFTGKILE